MKVKVEHFEKFMKEHKLSKIAFCKNCGITLKTFKNFLVKGKKCNIMTVAKIAEYTQLRWEDMFIEE